MVSKKTEPELPSAQQRQIPPSDQPLTSIPQTIFGPKLLIEGRARCFQVDIDKLVTMSLQDYFQT